MNVLEKIGIALLICLLFVGFVLFVGKFLAFNDLGDDE